MSEAMTVVTTMAVMTAETSISLEEARHQANAFRKADFLFARGYRAEWLTEDVLEMRNPRGRSYQVDTFNHECCCDGYILHGFCSHLWGWPKLLHDQQWQERYGNDNANR